MTTVASAKNQDPTLYSAYFGGPRDGLKTGDFPVTFSGKKLTGMLSKTPLSQPHQFSLYAVYVCTSETQIDGFWQFEYQGMEGPNGEQLVEAEPTREPSPKKDRGQAIIDAYRSANDMLRATSVTDRMRLFTRAKTLADLIDAGSPLRQPHHSLHEVGSLQKPANASEHPAAILIALLSRFTREDRDWLIEYGMPAETVDAMLIVDGEFQGLVGGRPGDGAEARSWGEIRREHFEHRLALVREAV